MRFLVARCVVRIAVSMPVKPSMYSSSSSSESECPSSLSVASVATMAVDAREIARVLAHGEAGREFAIAEAGYRLAQIVRMVSVGY